MMINDKMKTLTIEHLSAYLPYGLKFISGHYLVGVYGGGSDITRPILLSETMSGQIDWEANMDMDKPLLRPLSQLTETIENNGERFVPLKSVLSTCMKGGKHERDFLYSVSTRNLFIESLPMWAMRKLHSWHFDTFGLIDAGLAIPIPSTPPQP